MSLHTFNISGPKFQELCVFERHLAEIVISKLGVTAIPSYRSVTIAVFTDPQTENDFRSLAGGALQTIQDLKPTRSKDLPDHLGIAVTSREFVYIANDFLYTHFPGLRFSLHDLVKRGDFLFGVRDLKALAEAGERLFTLRDFGRISSKLRTTKLKT
jgi:hypothetical protein